MPGLVLCVNPMNKRMAIIISLEKIIIKAIVRNKIIETNRHDDTALYDTLIPWGTICAMWNAST